MLHIPVHRLDPDLPLPAYARHGDAGLDLYARVDAVLAPAGGRAAVPTGLAIAIPEGHAGLVLPRSGLAARHGLTELNTPGLVDAGYRGELTVLLVNTDPEHSYTVRRGERIAQLLVVPFPSVTLVEVDELPPSPTGPDGAAARGTGGFGHSGR